MSATLATPAKRQPNTKGEHIFPATIIEPMALRWKSLTAAGIHEEANGLLGEIIVLSTPMLARFAQHERYNVTVDLQILVSMAQSRIETWMRYWDPAKGRIFSWFTKCAKHVYLGEVAKAQVYRQRYHATSDSLEQIAGALDPQIDADADIEHVQSALADIECRWSNPQVIDCIRFHIASIVENPRGPKKPVIRAGSFASGLSIELSRFAHNWALFAIRSAMYHRLKPHYSDVDLITYSESFTLFPDLLDIITVAQLKKLIAVMGGQRLRIPTVAQVEKLVRNQKLAAALASHSHLTPTSLSAVARDHGVRDRTAEEVFVAMSEMLDPERNTQSPVYS